MDGGVGEAREERVAVVNSGQNKRDNKFGGVFTDLTDAMEMEVAGPAVAEMKLVMDREQSRMTPRFLTESEMGMEVLLS